MLVSDTTQFAKYLRHFIAIHDSEPTNEAAKVLATGVAYQMMSWQHKKKKTSASSKVKCKNGHQDVHLGVSRIFFRKTVIFSLSLSRLPVQQFKHFENPSLEIKHWLSHSLHVMSLKDLSASVLDFCKNETSLPEGLNKCTRLMEIKP